ncbi:heme biosynthesis HemY N-terminal domain-containing protein [Aureimonas sp. ME7]|uniref:heme biosynthesis protein HemY n=1 Tax=Aureimonas sp. ME7 TaxID=2744252 RepID=UPI0015F71D0D|nr:heme biosynthesis HemY N-terminal domain-containing protein [Aureimonas sp. ME7]
MLAILAFFLVVLAAGLGFAWLADHPGTVSLVWQGQEVGTSFTVFVVAQILLVVAAILLFWLVRGFFKAPDRVSRFFSTRRRDKGYRALSAGIIAVGAGDAVTARRMTKQAAKSLPNRSEPMLRFLDAQTALIEGDNGRARSIFEELEAQPETRLVGLRGLYLEAERLGDRSAARGFAERAVRIAPHVGWAGGAVLDLKAAQGDYDGALAILEAQRDSRLIDKAESRRLRAVLLTGKAMTLADADPAGSRAAAREAQKLAPDLVPAAVAAGRAAVRLGDTSSASKALQASWKIEPHPQVAALYVHARPGDGVEERLKRARIIAALQPGHVESHLVVAQAALDARDFTTARAEALAAAEREPREATYLLLADIEDAESGNEALVRQWMNRALHAPKDAAWTADGVTSAEWSPVSPLTGRLDAFRWVAPPAPPSVRALSDEGSVPALGSRPLRDGDDVASTGAVDGGAATRAGQHVDA